MTLQEALDNWAIFKFDLGAALVDNDVQVDQSMFDALDVIERAARGVLAAMRGEYDEEGHTPCADSPKPCGCETVFIEFNAELRSYTVDGTALKPGIYAIVPISETE